MNTIELMLDLTRQIVNAVPALQDGGGFIQENYDGDGRYMGDSQIDPMAVIQQMQELAHKAIAIGEQELAREPTTFVYDLLPGEDEKYKEIPVWAREEIK